MRGARGVAGGLATTSGDVWRRARRRAAGSGQCWLGQAWFVCVCRMFGMWEVVSSLRL